MDKSSNRVETNIALFIVLFEKNVQFTGRESELAELEKKLFVGLQTTKIAVTGITGVGKTQLVLELVYRTKQTFKNCSVFWIPANDMKSLYQAYTHIA